jgi:hypothetical protein
MATWGRLKKGSDLETKLAEVAKGGRITHSMY